MEDSAEKRETQYKKLLFKVGKEMGSNGNENTRKQNDTTRNLTEETLCPAGLQAYFNIK